MLRCSEFTLIHFRKQQKPLAIFVFFFFQAEDGIRDLVRSRGLGDVYKRQSVPTSTNLPRSGLISGETGDDLTDFDGASEILRTCLLYTSDAADERSSVDLGGRRIIKKKKAEQTVMTRIA